MTRDALVVGINNYANDFDDLKTPAGDAEAIAQLLEQYGDFNVIKRLPECTDDDKFKVDPNPKDKEAQVTVAKLQQALERLFDPEGDNVPGTALFFFAGHGHRVKNQNGQYEGFLATSESHQDPAKGKPGLSLQWLRKLLERSPVREQVVWLDCCYSGELLNFEEVNLAFWKGHDCCFIAASRGHEVSYQHSDGKHGMLSGVLLKGLDPRRMDKGTINSSDLKSFIDDQKGWPQLPICLVSRQSIKLTRSVWNPNTLTTRKKSIGGLSVQEVELEIKELFDNPQYHSTIIKTLADHPLVVQKFIDDPTISANIKSVLNSSEDYNKLSVFVTSTSQIQNEKYDDRSVYLLKVANNEKLSVDSPEQMDEVKMDEVLNLLNNQSPQESTKNDRSESFLNLVAVNDGELLMSKMKKEKIEKENILDESELTSSQTLWKKLISKIYLLMGKGSNQTTNYEFAIKRGYYIYMAKEINSSESNIQQPTGLKSKRQFRFQTLTKPTGAGEGLLDIPHPLILHYKSPQELIEEFHTTWGMPPKGVILPVVTTDGLLYECEGTDLPFSRYASVDGQYLGFEKTVEAFGKEASIEKIYLSVDPTLQFVTMDGLHVVDIVGDSSQQVCIGNPRTQELLGAILGIGIDIVLNVLADPKKLAGAVIDAVDLWPQGADNDRLELTCFCESCLKYFKTMDAGLITKFKDFPNPWNLVLRGDKMGIGYIDDLPKDITPSQVIGLSRQKGYLEIFKDKPQPELEQLARDLLRYIQVRHNQTVNAIHKIFDEAFQGLNDQGPSLQRIVLLEGIHLDWTSGLQLQRLDEPDETIKPFDETWFNSTSFDMFTTKVPFRSYMWRRSRYLIDAFLQAIANATDPGKRTTTGIARWSEEDIREGLLRKRFRGAISTSDSKRTSLAALPPLTGTSDSDSQRVGFVGVAFLSEEDGNKFIDGLVIPSSGAVSLRKSGRGSGQNDDDMLLSLLRGLRQTKE